MSLTAVAPFDYAAYPQTPVPTCPVCGLPNVSVPTTDRYGYAVGTSTCPCGFAYLNPQLTADGYRAFYTDAYRPLIEAVRTRQGVAPVPAAHLVAFIDAQRGQVIATGAADLQPPRRVRALCDVGGSTGAVAATVVSMWPADQVTVIDPNPAELATAAALGFATVCAVAEDRPALPPQDLVICAQTLDHVCDPLGVLRWLRETLAPGGWFYVDVVEARRWAVLQGDAPTAWKLDHPCYWTPHSLVRALTQTGWRPRRARRVDRYHYAAWCEGA